MMWYVFFEDKVCNLPIYEHHFFRSSNGDSSFRFKIRRYLIDDLSKAFSKNIIFHNYDVLSVMIENDFVDKQYVRLTFNPHTSDMGDDYFYIEGTVNYESSDLTRSPNFLSYIRDLKLNFLL